MNIILHKIRHIKYLLILIIITLLFTFVFSHIFGNSSTKQALGLDLFPKYFIEISSIFTLLYLAEAIKKIGTIAAYFILFICLQIYASQYLAVHFSGEFISPVALENTHDAPMLFTTFSTIISLIPISIITIIVGYKFFKKSKISLLPQGAKTNGTLLQLLLVIIICLTLPYINGEYNTSNASTGENESNITDTPPLAAFASTVFLTSTRTAPQTQLNASKAWFARRLGINITISSEYPFDKNYIYHKKLPYENISNITKPNVIILFPDALSTAKLSIYNQNLPDISPNIEAFAKQSMIVNNYFNHTAATYRGLKGQLCSIYPFDGGLDQLVPEAIAKQSPMRCLPHLFAENNYQTIFAGCVGKPVFESFLSKLGFNQIYSRDRIAAEFLTSEQVGMFLTDRQLYRFLTNFIKTKQYGTQPFLLGVYSNGTHTAMQRPPDGKKYRDGSNYVLDTAYNYDDVFGEFWNEFKKSPLSTNTIVVLTGDHAHAPEDEFMKIVGPNYKRVFIGSLSLIIYDPTHNLPKDISANYTTSLALAPTVAHLAKLPNTNNSFLGQSIFEIVDNFDEDIKGFGSYGINVCTVKKDKISYYDGNNKKMSPKPAALYDVIQFSHKLELQGKLWKIN